MEQKHYNENRLSQDFHEVLKSREHERYHEFPNSGQRDEVYQVADSLIKAILDGSTDIISNVSVQDAKRAWRDLVKAPDDHVLRVAWELLDEKLGTRTIIAQKMAEERFFHLLAWCSDGNVSPLTKHYLHRAAECYLYGFDEQCVIMCRSSLEAAFSNAVPDKTCEDSPRLKQKYKGRNQHDFTLKDRIEVAKDTNTCTQNVYDYANWIRNTANDVVHKGRNAIKEEELRNIVMKTIVCVSELEKIERGVTNG